MKRQIKSWIYIVKEQITEVHLSDEMTFNLVNADVGSDHSLESEEDNFTKGRKTFHTNSLWHLAHQELNDFTIEYEKFMINS